MHGDESSVFSSPKDGSTNSFTTVENSGSENDYPHYQADLAGENHVKLKKKMHRSRGLEDLLNEANRYSPQYGDSLPHGFLRDRRQNKSVTEEPEFKKRRNEIPDSKGLREKLEQVETQPTRVKDAKKLTASVKAPKLSRKRPKTDVKTTAGRTKKVQTKEVKSKVKVSPKETQKSNEVRKAENCYFVDSSSSSFEIQYDMFNVDYLKTHTQFEGSPLPSTILASKSCQKDEKTVTVSLQSLLYPNYQEQYHINFDIDAVKYDPMSEIGKIVEYTAKIFTPKPHSNLIKKKILPDLRHAFDTSDSELFAQKVQEYNDLIRLIPRTHILKHLSTVKILPRSFIHDLLHIVYTRSIIPSFRKLKEYEAFSNYVYGELLPNFLSDVYSKCGLQPHHQFMDLGSGVGNCVVQAALEYGCKLSFGCEIMSNASQLTEDQFKELKERCKLFGLKLNPVEFSLRKSFVDNDRVKELVSQCDVILINNFLFDSELNRKVEEIIKNAKVGAKIISLKNPRGRGYTINFFNVESILNRLHVERFALEKGSVSWTHNGGEYYLSTVLPDFDESLFDPSERKRNTKRPQRYTR